MRHGPSPGSCAKLPFFAKEHPLLPAGLKCFCQTAKSAYPPDLIAGRTISSAQPEFIDSRLDDFRTRLQWGLLLQLAESDDEQVRRILRLRAGLLGFELSQDVISYLMRHHARNLSAQMQILKRLDGASLAQQRKVTIPLVKKALAQPD